MSQEEINKVVEENENLKKTIESLEQKNNNLTQDNKRKKKEINELKPIKHYYL